MPFQNNFLTKRKYTQKTSQELRDSQFRYFMPLIDENKPASQSKFQFKTFNMVEEKTSNQVFKISQKDSKQEEQELTWNSNFISFNFNEIQNAEQEFQFKDSSFYFQNSMILMTNDTNNW